MNKIYVGNLPFQTTEQDLESAFSQFGDITAIDIITDRMSGRSKGFAFVTFESDSAVQGALSLDGTDFGGRNIKVNVAKEKTGGGRRDDRGGNRERRDW